MHQCFARTLIFSTLLLGIFAGFMCVSASAETLAAKTYYVSTTGSNSNPGTQDSPWATPAYGAKKLKAGDTLIIEAGTYVIADSSAVLKPRSGSSVAAITIEGKSSKGEKPVLAGRGNVRAAIDLSGTKYVKIQGLEITHDSTATGDDLLMKDGVVILGKAASDIILDDLYIHHIDNTGLNIQDVDKIQVTSCRIEYCGNDAASGPAGKSGGWKNVKIESSRLSYSGHYYQGGAGSNRPNKTPDGLFVRASAGPVEVQSCTFEHNYGDGVESYAPNTYIHETILANNICNGIRFWVDNGKAENCLIYGIGDKAPNTGIYAGIMIEGITSGNPRFFLTNVTVDDNQSRQGFMAEFQRYANGWINLTMKNCIFANGGGAVCMYKTVKAKVENSLFLRSGARNQVEYEGVTYTGDQIESGKIGPGNLSRDPKYVKRSWGGVGDYHLQKTSPCIDAGTANGAPDIDLSGTARPQGAGFDMGCYEQKK